MALKLSQLKNREQALLALTIAAAVLGGYVSLRYMPANKHIAELTQATEATQLRLQTTTIPEEPSEDIDKLTHQLDEQEHEMAAVKTQAESILQGLAPPDSLELRVAISQLARLHQIHVRSNETMKPDGQAAAPTPAVSKKKRKGAAATTTPTAPTANSALIQPPTASWIARMSPGTVFYRPMQRLELEASYESLRQFIYGLDHLPFPVTVLRMTVERMPTLAPPGYPQVLVAELVLAL
ncbi:MAG: hypothetical protein KGZ80_11360 [Methylomonas sp.]|nr:hypothetical protein [Methylomonas sp.]PPD21149.1 MAG: hypothetical protein CTY23_06580 [Methylomonas sp.]PPD27584.1 MAG: hypothetical protein CTY22_01615 [Methylomonas sp.]PPD39580.1 MAG: hypothetical protein CTY21_01610 [Methylomonas sp.]PPD55831.1 MAG: hypothetical protein CTY11_00880 [Methylomonas sp.]